MKIECLVAMLVALSVHKMLARGSLTSDSCDWIGSGTPEMAESRGIQPVYLRCSQGTIRWHYPQGALRVMLRNGVAGNEFRACFRVTKGSSGARLFVAGRKKLHLVFRKDNPIDLIRCVTSREGQLILYVEADTVTGPLRKTVTEYNYQLKKMPKGLGNDNDDCRPCQEEDLLHQYCTSDFVARGTVSSLFHNSLLQRSEITVRATKVYRDSEPPAFGAGRTSTMQKRTKYATLHRPLHCGTKAGIGEYIFFGTWTLGNPILTCVPRLADWKKVRRKALKHRTNLCQLDL